MFNKTIIHHSNQPSHISKTVNIHRQSTAEDARLLSDLEKEAANKIRNVVLFDVSSIGMEFITYQYHKNAFDIKHQTYIAFKLNGEEFHVKVEEDNIDSPQQEWVHKFYEVLSTVIAEKLITQHQVLEERARQERYNNGL